MEELKEDFRLQWNKLNAMNDEEYEEHFRRKTKPKSISVNDMPIEEYIKFLDKELESA